jgi:hypothetical protein
MEVPMTLLSTAKRAWKWLYRCLNWGIMVFSGLAWFASYAMAQMPGITGVCAYKTWVLALAGAFAIAGVAWLGAMMTYARNHGDGMHPLVEKLPGLILVFAAATVGTWFGAAYC